MALIAVFLLFVAEVASAAQRDRTIWFLSNGFHTAVAIRTEEAGPFLRSTSADPEAKWLLFGWGDRDYFMVRNPSLWITLKALFWPTPSAIHVVPLRKLPQQVYRNSEVIELTVSVERHRAFVRYLEEQFAGFERQEPVFLGRGYTEVSGFFLGNEKFYFPKICNWWIARGLQKAGFPVHPIGSITAQELTRQMRKHGKRVGGLRLPVDGF